MGTILKWMHNFHEFRKVHENEENGTKGGLSALRPLLDSPIVKLKFGFCLQKINYEQIQQKLGESLNVLSDAGSKKSTTFSYTKQKRSICFFGNQIK